MAVLSLLNTQSPSQTLALQQLPQGYRFCPDEQELVRFFLYPKLTNPLVTSLSPVRDCNLYAHQPNQIWNTFHRLQGEDLFIFINLKRKTPDSNNFTRKIAGGPATWHREDNNHQIHVPIDRNCSVIAVRKCFSYQNTQSDQRVSCSWTMYEYSLSSLSQVIVLCQLRRKDDDNSHIMQTTKKRKRVADVVDDPANTIYQKARVDESDQQQKFIGASETVSELVFNEVKFDNFESFSHEVVQDFDDDQMAVHSVASTSYIAESTVSTSNCDKSLQPIEVVCIDNIDGEASATEQDDDFHKEILGKLDFSGCSDKRVEVPTIPITADADHEVQATSVGSTLVKSLTTDVVDHHLDSEVPDSSLRDAWRESFSQKLLQANPTCLIQENEVQMIANTFYMKCSYRFHQK
ncbi:unnamed protein product [Dovyalis caffra]|uniref:NAC domain-containing protein n=1 Tax=Dovyalis caffra TaxID=77055 RepID=A0AAV1RPU4_9ROSI|nr:unnamed protein product [Dovyalis caffra]